MLPLPHSMLYCGGEPRHCPQVMTVLPTASAKPKLPHSFNRCQTSVINTKTTRTTQKQGCVILVPKPQGLVIARRGSATWQSHQPYARCHQHSRCTLFFNIAYFLFARRSHWLRQMPTLPCSMLYCGGEVPPCPQETSGNAPLSSCRPPATESAQRKCKANHNHRYVAAKKSNPQLQKQKK